MLVGHIVAELERFAPPALQESYDNTGLILGSATDECTGVLVTVDVTEAVIEEAVAHGLNLIVAHHPLIFKGIKRLNGSTPQQRAILAAIRAGVAVYACHTSLDSACGGVSQRMAAMLGLCDVKPLEPAEGKMVKLQVFVPEDNVDEVRMALFDAGAGRIGRYDSCSYTLHGEGTFRPLEGANPYVGTTGELHFEKERCVQVVLPRWRMRAVESALLQVHPYEEPAYEFYDITGNLPMTGLGAVGNLPKAMSPRELANLVKRTFGSPVARCSAADAALEIKRVAMCGGSGASLIPQAISAKATAYITSDVKYHDFTDFGSDLFIIDIGHHQSDNCSKTIIFDIISEKFPNFAIRNSQADVNPIKYL